MDQLPPIDRHDNLQQETDPLDIHFFNIHGCVLWVAWGIVTLLQIASIRYLRPCKKLSYFIHLLTGLVIVIATIVLGIFISNIYILFYIY